MPRRAGAAAHPGGDEHHVAPSDSESLSACRPRAPRGPSRDRRPRRARVSLPADLHLTGGAWAVEGLHVGVGRDELDASEAELDHRVDRVAARAADADDLDARLVELEFDRSSGQSPCSHRGPAGPRSFFCAAPVARLKADVADHG